MVALDLNPEVAQQGIAWLQWTVMGRQGTALFLISLLVKGWIFLHRITIRFDKLYALQ